MKGAIIGQRRMGRIASRLVVYGLLAFVFAISVFPILWVIMSSFKDNSAILGSPFSLPSRLDFRAYAEVFTQYSFGIYTFNSLAVATVATLASLVVYSMGAYAIAKFNFPGKNLFYILFTLTLLVPAQSRAEPIFSIILKLGLYDTKAALMIVYQSAGLAMSMFILRATFMSLPKELNEAAQIDGASFVRTFWIVNLPLAKTGLATAGIMMFLGNWNEYFYAMLLTSSPTNRTLPLALGFFSEAFSYDYTKMFAALTIVVVPGILIYTLAQEQVQASVASSGIKG
ncbi:MAG: carbohydrate ABC transporter permease [Spirochaetaceae bacterium]|nr:carbohydrate ABC transporter permease [Spirochaetaceae bacterium]